MSTVTISGATTVTFAPMGVVLAIDGVGGLQVYPTWDGGGTVKLSVMGSDWMPASPQLVETVQNTVDPPVLPQLQVRASPVDGQAGDVDHAGYGQHGSRDAGGVNPGGVMGHSGSVRLVPFPAYVEHIGVHFWGQCGGL